MTSSHCAENDKFARVDVIQDGGYIMPPAARDVTRGSRTCPWLIAAHPGERIEIDLIRLGSGSSAYDGMTSAEGGISTCLGVGVASEALQLKPLVRVLL